MKLKEFLEEVVTTPTGWFLLSHSTAEPPHSYVEEWFGWPDDINQIIDRATQLSVDHNVFFSPYLFSERRSIKACVLPGRTIVADLDDANVNTLTIRPSVLVESSPDRHQGYWILAEELESMELHEELSRRLTYSIPRCDSNGWYLGKRLRLPETFNFKYASGPKLVCVLQNNGLRHTQTVFDMLPAGPIAQHINANEEGELATAGWLQAAENYDVGPQEILFSLSEKLPNKVVMEYDSVVTSGEGRSGALWALMTNAFRAGATREQVYVLAKGSANNKFTDLRYGGTRELAKDVLRAEAVALSPLSGSDIKNKIREIRRLRGAKSEKMEFMAEVVKDYLTKLGHFVNCQDGTLWYIRDDTGRPINIGTRSTHLNVLLESLFGINASEAEYRYVSHNLISYCSSLPATGTVASMTKYEDSDEYKLFLHTGRKEVLIVTKDGIKSVTNGYQDIIFPWDNMDDQIYPDYESSQTSTLWYEILLGDCLDNLIGMERNEAMALLRVWLITILFRTSLMSRPILALFGQPGSGKSTMFRRIYILLYGRRKALNAITNVEDFDFAVSQDPLVVMDNVDTWERWLPDRLALSASSSEIKKRKLFTDADSHTLTRQAMLGITAHNPKFGREDVTDRLILLTFERLKHFKSETDIINYIVKSRNNLWGQLLGDIQKVFSTPRPPTSESPQFRIEDFSHVGYWIATALGIADDFKSAIGTLRGVQHKFNLEEDHNLVSAIQTWLTKCKTPEDYRTPAQLWTLLEVNSSDPRAYAKQYRNSQGLGRKLWSMQDSLKSLYDVQWIFDEARGSRAWRFLPKAPKV